MSKPQWNHSERKKQEEGLTTAAAVSSQLVSIPKTTKSSWEPGVSLWDFEIFKLNADKWAETDFNEDLRGTHDDGCVCSRNRVVLKALSVYKIEGLGNIWKIFRCNTEVIRDIILRFLTIVCLAGEKTGGKGRNLIERDSPEPAGADESANPANRNQSWTGWSWPLRGFLTWRNPLK